MSSRGPSTRSRRRSTPSSALEIANSALCSGSHACRSQSDFRSPCRGACPTHRSPPEIQLGSDELPTTSHRRRRARILVHHGRRSAWPPASTAGPRGSRWSETSAMSLKPQDICAKARGLQLRVLQHSCQLLDSNGLQTCQIALARCHSMIQMLNWLLIEGNGVRELR